MPTQDPIEPSDAQPETMPKAKAAGFDGLLGKPIQPSIFPDQLTEILGGKDVWHLGQN